MNSFFKRRRALISLGMADATEIVLSLSDSFSAIMVTNMIGSITDSVEASTQIPVGVNASDSFSTMSVHQMMQSYYDSVSASTMVPESATATESISPFSVKNMFDIPQ